MSAYYKMKENGKTVVVDTEAGDYVFTIIEHPDREPTYEGNPPLEQRNMSEQELHDYIAGLVGDLEIIEEVIEVEEVADANDLSDSPEIIEEQRKNQSDPVYPFAVLDYTPTFKGCDSGDMDGKMKCTQTRIAEFVNQNFNTAARGNLTGTQKISVQFTIDKNGDVIDVKGKSKSKQLTSEAVRVVYSLPKFNPGKINGKNVNVRYSLPIVLELN